MLVGARGGAGQVIVPHEGLGGRPVPRRSAGARLVIVPHEGLGVRR